MFRGLGFQAITAGVLYCCQIGYSRRNRLRCSLLVCGDPAGNNPGRIGSRIETHRVRVMLTSLLCVLFLGSTATEPMIRSLVTQKAAPEAASGPAVFTIELGKPAVGGGAAGDVWVARKLLRRGSSGGVNSGSRHYHNFNLYCAGFGPFLAAAVAQAAGAAAGKWARYSRRSKPALTALVRPLTLTLSFPFCRFRRRCACV